MRSRIKSTVSYMSYVRPEMRLQLNIRSNFHLTTLRMNEIFEITFLNEFFRVLVKSPPDGDPLFLLHGHVLLKVPGFDHFDGGKDHVLSHSQMLLLPSRNDPVNNRDG